MSAASICPKCGRENFEIAERESVCGWCDHGDKPDAATDSRVERFHAAMERLTEEVDSWQRLLHDPFKAPELKIGLPRDVTAAAWEVGIAWHLMVEEK